MKKVLFVILLICIKLASAQTVVIPDTAFVSYLHTVIPTAMTGNLMDTSSSAVTTLDSIDVSNHLITDLTGIKYFVSLTYLQCSYNSLTSLPPLPNSLRYLMCSTNHLTWLPSLPDSLLNLYCQQNQLTNLPALPDSLQILDCSSNQLTYLPALDNQLWDLRCNSNQLTSLPTLPNIIDDLFCNHNLLTSLPLLPNNLTGPFFELLECSYNQLTSLPTLPNHLLYFHCDNNQLTNLPALPPILEELLCQQNQLTNLPALPHYLRTLECNNNNILCFPIFPNSIINSANGNFNVSNNPFNCLPNYISAMDSATLTIPICIAGNTNGCTVTGINELTDKEEINIYPNLTLDYLNINLTAAKQGDATITISDVVGQILKEKKMKVEQGKSETQIDVSNLSNGIYICTVTSNYKKSTLKFIKQ